MTRYASQSLAAFAALALAIGIWLPTLAPVTGAATYAVTASNGAELA